MLENRNNNTAHLKPGCGSGQTRELLFILANDPLVVTFLTTCINWPGTNADLEKTVAVTSTTGSRVGTFLRETELHPESPKQLDDCHSDQIQRNQRDN